MTKLEKTRREALLTQLELAEKVRLAVGVYQRYESGQRIPKADVAIRIAKALNSTVEKLFS